jgi:hypothetical protein
MHTEVIPNKSSVNLLMEDMSAFDAAKNANCRFGVVYDLGQIVRERAESARERVLYFAMHALGNAVTA